MTSETIRRYIKSLRDEVIPACFWSSRDFRNHWAKKVVENCSFLGETKQDQERNKSEEVERWKDFVPFVQDPKTLTSFYEGRFAWF